jgi:cell division septum initiation protein DivIVA
MSDVVQSVRQLFQDFIAPELRALKSDVKQVDSKIDLETESLKAKIGSETSQLRTDLKRLEDKMDSDSKRVEDKMDSGFAQMRTLLENAYLRSELEATRDISNLRERVTRLEVERGSRQ